MDPSQKIKSIITPPILPKENQSTKSLGHSSSTYLSSDEKGIKRQKTNKEEHGNIEPLSKKIFDSSSYSPTTPNSQSDTKKRKVEDMTKKEERKIDHDREKKHEGNYTHNLPMAGEIYLKMIMNGDKKYEGRINGPLCHKIKVGDNLELFDRRAGWGIICQVTEKKAFKTFKEMISDIGELNLLPHLKDEFRKLSSEEALKKAIRVYEGFPGSSRVSNAGCVAIGVKFIKKI